MEKITVTCDVCGGVVPKGKPLAQIHVQDRGWTDYCRDLLLHDYLIDICPSCEHEIAAQCGVDLKKRYKPHASGEYDTGHICRDLLLETLRTTLLLWRAHP